MSLRDELRAEARRAFRELATVTTRPTDKGRAEIDVCHEYHGLQYLQNKKVAEFLDGASANPPRRHRAGRPFAALLAKSWS